MNKKLNIAVVCGGISSEREVSLNSGNSVYDALCEYGFENVSLFDLKEDNFSDLIKLKPDICFLALHGKGGEDGSIQGALDTAGIKYTFSGVEASAVSMNKIIAKKIFVSSDIPTSDYFTVNKYDYRNNEEAAKEILNTIPVPLVIKPPLEGSSIGVQIVKSEERLGTALDEAFKFSDDLLIERFIGGIEVTVPVLGNKDKKALPVIEITSSNEFYDYESKYTPGMCKHIIPARISDEDRIKCESIAIKACTVLGCKGIARVDMIIDKEKGPMAIEVNTIPGMTKMSLVPDSARAMGIEFPELCAEFIKLALE